MPTLEDVIRSALAELNSDAGLPACETWAQERYAELVAGFRPRQLRQVGSLTIPAAVTTGTISITQGQSVVTGDGTAMNAWAALGESLVGRHIRIGRIWSRIAALVDLPTIQLGLDAPYPEDDVTDGAYAIVQRTVAMPAGERFFGTFVSQRWWRPLRQWTPGMLDHYYPERMLMYGGPEVVSEVGEQGGSKVLEFYPYANEIERIDYTYWRLPELTLRSELPLPLDTWMLRDGLLVNIMRYEMAKAMKQNMADKAQFWRNEYRAQETKWKDTQERARMNDHGLDDMQILVRTGDGTSRRDISSARDFVVARGQRP